MKNYKEIFRQAKAQRFHNQTHIKGNTKVYSSKTKQIISNENKALQEGIKNTEGGEEKMNIDYIMQ